LEAASFSVNVDQQVIQSRIFRGPWRRIEAVGAALIKPGRYYEGTAIVSKKAMRRQIR
jgi:hypothetical protein